MGPGNCVCCRNLVLQNQFSRHPYGRHRRDAPQESQKANSNYTPSFVPGMTQYWSAFDTVIQRDIEEVAKNLYNTLFEPEVDQPVRILDLPLAGSSSPLEALSVLVELLAICDLSFTKHGDFSSRYQKGITSYAGYRQYVHSKSSREYLAGYRSYDRERKRKSSSSCGLLL